MKPLGQTVVISGAPAAVTAQREGLHPKDPKRPLLLSHPLTYALLPLSWGSTVPSPELSFPTSF